MLNFCSVSECLFNLKIVLLRMKSVKIVGTKDVNKRIARGVAEGKLKILGEIVTNIFFSGKEKNLNAFIMG